MSNDDLVLTSPQVADVIGVSSRIPSLWAERRYLSPSVKAAEGRGSKRLWSRTDTVHALLVKLLINHLSTDTLRLIAHAFEGWSSALDAHVLWRIPLNAEEGVLVRFYEDDADQPSYQRRSRKIPSVTGFAGEGGAPDTEGNKEESDAGAYLVVNMEQLHATVNRGIEKLKF